MVARHSLRRRDLLRMGVGALAPVFSPSGRARAAGPVPVTIANAQGNMTMVMNALMRQQKLLEGAGLAPELMDIADGTKILAGMVGGDVDCSMMSGFGQVFPADEKGGSIKVLAGGCLLPNLAVFSAKPDLNSVTQLAGRTVGTGSLGALLHQLMVALLLKKGVDPREIRFVNVGSSADVFRAVSAGIVDAGPGDIANLDDPDRFHVHGLDGGNMSVELSEFTFQGAWASEHAIAAKRDAIVRSLAAYARLYRFVHTPQAHEPFLAAWGTLMKGRDPGVGEGLWAYIQKYKPFAVDLVLSQQRIDYMQGLNVQVNVQKSVLPYDRVADMTLAHDALKML